MSSFSQAVKYLKVTPSRVASANDLQSSQSLIKPTKYITLVPGRALHTVETALQFFPFNYTWAQIQNRPVPDMLFQYNITVPESFYLLNANRIPSVEFDPNAAISGGILAIKWRNGTNVTRRLIAGDPTLAGTITRNFYYPNYSNELVPANFCIEFWMTFKKNISKLLFGIVNQFNLNLSILSLPPDPNNEYLFNPVSNPPFQVQDLGFNIPVMLPVNQPNIVWNDN